MHERMKDPADHPFALVSQIRSGFAKDVYQDFQEYVYERFGKSSIVYVRTGESTVTPCQPREPYKGFCSFCDEVRRVFGTPGSGEFSYCVQKEKEILEKNIEREARGERVEWGWRICPFGLKEFFVPIRSRDREEGKPGDILAILVMGHGVSTESKLDDVRKCVRHHTTGREGEQRFRDRTLQEREGLEERLLEKVYSIPILSDENQENILKEMKDLLSLMEITATRTLHLGKFREGDEFVERLGLRIQDPRTDATAMQKTLGDALTEIVQFRELGVQSAVLYSSSYADYSELSRTVTFPQSLTLADSIGLRSYEEFQSLESEHSIDLPETTGSLEWLDPHSYFGANKAILFGKELLGGTLMLLGFGLKSDRLKDHQRATLLSAVYDKIFPYVASALYAIQQNHLMAEAGHLMARNRGKLQGAYLTFRDILDEIPEILTSENRDAFEAASWAEEDGLMHLDLINTNFFAFREPSLEKADTSPRSAKRSTADVVKVLGSMKGYFEQSIREAGLTSLKYTTLWPELCIESPMDEAETQHRLKMVFLNLFDNALKFSFRDQYITVRIARTEKEAIVEFTNFGTGVAEDEHERVFRRFTKSRFQDPARRQEGLGLGLSYCKRVVEKDLKGTIVLKSWDNSKHAGQEGLGWLTTVTVRLPLAIVQKGQPEKNA